MVVPGVVVLKLKVALLSPTSRPGPLPRSPVDSVPPRAARGGQRLGKAPAESYVSTLFLNGCFLLSFLTRL